MLVSSSLIGKLPPPRIPSRLRLRGCGYSQRFPFVSSFPPPAASISSPRRPASGGPVSDSDRPEGDEDLEFQVVTAVNTSYNDIVILDTSDSRMLLLDSTHNVHSIFKKRDKWTSSYWDEFASLPAIIPKGPVVILGLGGGTAAHLMLDLWPSLHLDGWEIDEILIDRARVYLGLSDLERRRESGGILQVHIGDALSPSVMTPGGYAGIIVDLFSDGKVLPQLEEVSTWLDMKSKLMSNGRIMVNCGAATGVAAEAVNKINCHEATDGNWELNSVIKALWKAFPEQVSWKKMPKEDGENYLALTGPLPDLTEWSTVLPDPLSSSVKHWRVYKPS